LARWSTIGTHLLQRIFGSMIAAAADPDMARAVVDRGESALGRDDQCAFCSIMWAVPAAQACGRRAAIGRGPVAVQGLSRRRPRRPRAPAALSLVHHVLLVPDFRSGPARGQPAQVGANCCPVGHSEPQPRPATATRPSRCAWSRTACTKGAGSPRRVATCAGVPPRAATSASTAAHALIAATRLGTPGPQASMRRRAVRRVPTPSAANRTGGTAHPGPRHRGCTRAQRP
jgi:hypothetical protein